MAGRNLALYKTQARGMKRRVFYTGDGALSAGYGVCYDRDYGTATAEDGLRDKRVALPDNTNNLAFAGVVTQDYSAVVGGQWIEIYEPGSVCPVYVDASVTIGQNNFVTCQIGGGGSGTFEVARPGFMGKGTARVMQTRTGAGLIMAELMDGPESGLVETIATATLTAGGAITCMVGGVTIFAGPATPAADCTFTLADGTHPGQRKAFFLDGALTTNDIEITVTSGVQLDGSTALANLQLDGDNDQSVLEFGGFGDDTGTWRLLHNVGTGLS